MSNIENTKQTEINERRRCREKFSKVTTDRITIKKFEKYSDIEQKILCEAIDLNLNVAKWVNAEFNINQIKFMLNEAMDFKKDLYITIENLVDKYKLSEEWNNEIVCLLKYHIRNINDYSPNNKIIGAYAHSKPTIEFINRSTSNIDYKEISFTKRLEIEYYIAYLIQQGYSKEEIELITKCMVDSLDITLLLDLKGNISYMKLCEKLLRKKKSVDYIRVIKKQDFKNNELSILNKFLEKDIDIISLCTRSIQEDNFHPIKWMKKSGDWETKIVNHIENQSKKLNVKTSNSNNNEVLRAFVRFAKRKNYDKQYMMSCIRIIKDQDFSKSKQKIIKWIDNNINIFRYITYLYTTTQIEAIASVNKRDSYFDEIILPTHNATIIRQIGHYLYNRGVNIKQFIDKNIETREFKKYIPYIENNKTIEVQEIMDLYEKGYKSNEILQYLKILNTGVVFDEDIREKFFKGYTEEQSKELFAIIHLLHLDRYSDEISEYVIESDETYQLLGYINNKLDKDVLKGVKDALKAGGTMSELKELITG